jgi:hypothetical protein
MTQTQLDGAIADVTGESLAIVHDFGFSLPGTLEPEDLCLVLDCQFCRRPFPFPGRVKGGVLAQAECLDCDVYFEPKEHEVYAANPAVLVASARSPQDASPAGRP